MFACFISRNIALIIFMNPTIPSLRLSEGRQLVLIKVGSSFPLAVIRNLDNYIYH